MLFPVVIFLNTEVLQLFVKTWHFKGSERCIWVVVDL